MDDAAGSTGPGPAGGTTPSSTGAPSNGFGRAGWGDFFAFRVMLTPSLIRIVYAIGAVLITVAAIALPLLTTMVTVCEGSGDAPAVCTSLGLGPLVYAYLVAFVWWIVAQLCLRVVMELIMVIFGIHESVRAIEGPNRR